MAILAERLENPGYFTLWALSVVVPLLKLQGRKYFFWPLLAVTVVGYALDIVWAVQGDSFIQQITQNYIYLTFFMAVSLLATMFFLFVILIWPMITSFLFILPVAVLLTGIGILIYEVYSYLTTGVWGGMFVSDIPQVAEFGAGGESPVKVRTLVYYLTNWTPVFVVLIFGGFLTIISGEAGINKMTGQLVEDYKALTEEGEPDWRDRDWMTRDKG